MLTPGLSQNLAYNPQNHEATFACSIAVLIFVTGYPGVCKDGDPDDFLHEILMIRSCLGGCSFLFHKVIDHHPEEKASMYQWIHRSKEGEQFLSIGLVQANEFEQVSKK